MRIELSRYTTNAINIQRKLSGYFPNGFDNLFPNYLDGLYNNSPTHQCIIDDLTAYVIGKGLISDNPQDEDKINRFFNKKFLSKLEKYRKIHSTVCLLVVRNSLNRIIDVEVVNPSQIRVASIKRGKPVSFRYKKTWDTKVNNYNYSNGEEIPCYDKFSKQSLLYWYDSGTFDLPYGRPSYLSATDPIEFEISLYVGDNHGAQNGMTPSAIVTMPTSGDEQKDKDAVNAINSNLSGVANKGKVATIHTKAGETTPPTVTLLNDNSKESKKVNYEVAESGILKGWRIPSPTLISGLNIKPTGFGDAEAEMQWALNTLKTKIIEPDQEDLIDILEPLMRDLEILGNVAFKEIEDINQAAQIEVEETVNVNDNLKNLTGKQFQGIERIVRKFKKDQITKDQAALMLKAGFGLSANEIETFLTSDVTELSKHLTLDQIIDSAESYADFDDYEIESIEDAGLTADEEKLYQQNIELARTGTARPNSKSNQDGSKGNVDYLIRYFYDGNSNPQREFCQKMMNANKIYRYEDIVNMSFANVNAGFGINGANNYDIFSYKGGPNCKHKWKRITYVKRKGTSIDAKSGVAQDKALSESQADQRGMIPTGTAREKQRTSETIPYNLPNRGYYRMKKEIITQLKSIANGIVN